MNNINSVKKKIIITMLITTALMFIITMYLISFYQNEYIFNKAKSSIELQRLYFTDYEQYSLLEKDNSNIFVSDYIILDEDDANKKDKRPSIVEKEKDLKRLYYEDKFRLDKFKFIQTEYGEFCVLPISIDSKDLDKNISESKKYKDKGKINFLLYTDINVASTILYTLYAIFALILIIALIAEGLIGYFIGKKLEEEQKKMKHFFQNASHELKTPLMSIQGYAQGIESGVIDDYSLASKTIIKQSKKMKLLIDEILNISKLDSKEYVLKEDVLDIRYIIDDSLQNFRRISKKKNINLSVLIDEDNAYIIGDALQIYKAINTVIDNAFKFAKSEVLIKTYPKDRFLCIEVFNDGNKIKKENLKHVFERFYSAGNFSSGIGLAMAKEIALLSKGDISIKNKIDGVCFEMLFPSTSLKTKK